MLIESLPGPEKSESGEWLQWGIEQSAELSRQLVKEAGIDLIDVSSGGLWAQQKISISPGYQVRFPSSPFFELGNLTRS